MIAPVLTAIGLMSGTACDGVDAALVRTDGQTVEWLGPSLTLPYAPALRHMLLETVRSMGQIGDIPALEHALTLAHAEAVQALLVQAGMAAEAVDVIGFHGQTIAHRPQEGITWQIGDAALLAERCGVAVVHDFRRRDVAAGGQGAPLVPVFHAALAARAGAELPVALLNLGGVGNLSWIGPEGAVHAFDTGPGNALLDDWTAQHTGAAFDDGGRLAAAGKVSEPVLAALLAHPYFQTPPPKSLDRMAFSLQPLAGLSPEDGAATLAALTGGAVAAGVRWLPEPPLRWYVCGGGRHNPGIMAALQRRLQAPVEPIETLGYNGDALEAQAFAFLAVRSLHGLPLTYPTTTGCRAPVSGGAHTLGDASGAVLSKILL